MIHKLLPKGKCICVELISEVETSGIVSRGGNRRFEPRTCLSLFLRRVLGRRTGNDHDTKTMPVLAHLISGPYAILLGSNTLDAFLRYYGLLEMEYELQLTAGGFLKHSHPFGV